jgi:hypothetical protein
MREPYDDDLDTEDLRAINGVIYLLDGDHDGLEKPSHSTSALINAACFLDDVNMTRLWLGFSEIARAVWQYKNNPDALEVMRSIAWKK